MVERIQFVRDAMHHTEHSRAEAVPIDPPTPHGSVESSNELSSKAR